MELAADASITTEIDGTSTDNGCVREDVATRNALTKIFPLVDPDETTLEMRLDTEIHPVASDDDWPTRTKTVRGKMEACPPPSRVTDVEDVAG